MDNKILLSWNVLMICSLFEVSVRYLMKKKYTQLGINLTEYLNTHFNKNNQLHRVLINFELGTSVLYLKTTLIYLYLTKPMIKNSLIKLLTL